MRLHELHRILVQAAHEQQARASARRPALTIRQVIPVRVLILAALSCLLLAAVALAAAGVLRTGKAVVPAHPLQPTVGLGVPSRGGSRILSLHWPDPAGGPEWGMRLIHTSRDLVCLQIGRLHAGQLGVLGVAGAFHDDGEFHALRPDDLHVPGTEGAPAAAACMAPGQTQSREVLGIPESGLPEHTGKALPASRQRWISYGLLGARALSVTYAYHGKTHRIPVEPHTGAYLIVLPAGTHTEPTTIEASSGSAGRLATPSGALTAITYRYRDATCQIIARHAPADPCPRPHPSPRPSILEPVASLHRPVHARLLKENAPVLSPQPQRREARYAVKVSFKAPYTVNNALSGYSLAMPSPCHEGIILDSLDRDITRGQTVTATITGAFANACGPTITIQALYSRHGSGLTSSDTTLIGKTVVRRPR